MSFEISAFRGISGNSGYIKAKVTGNQGANAKLTRFGTGFFGKVTGWLRKQDSSANTALRTNFVSALRWEYGAAFLESKEVSALLGEAQKFKTDSKPLSARLVRQIIAKGDTMKAAQDKGQPQVLAKLHLGGTNYNVSLSYENTKSMRAASERFQNHLRLNAEGSPAIWDIVRYLDLDLPDNEKMAMLKEGKLVGLTEAKLATLKETQRALLTEANLSMLKDIPGAVNFVQTFSIGENINDMVNIGTPQFKRHCSSVGINPDDVTAAASSKVQIPPRIPMLFETLVKKANEKPENFERALGELITYAPRQVEMLKNGIKAVSDPKIMFDGMSQREKQTLTSLRSDLEALLQEALDPDGFLQHLMAFATVSAMDPTAAQANIQRLLANH